MRPIKLTISAFGPYADLTVLDLDKLGENGLYLITGTTGAGKTSILTPLHMRFTENLAEVCVMILCCALSTQMLQQIHSLS